MADTKDCEEIFGLDDNLVLDESSLDNDNSGDSRRMECFERDVAKTYALAEAERRRVESNRRAQQGAKDPPNNTTPTANIPTATHGSDTGLTTSNAESMMKQEKHVATQIIHFVKSEVFYQIKFDDGAEMFQKAFV